LRAAIFMVFIALSSIPNFDTDILGVGGVLVGFVPLLLGQLRRTRGAKA